jgi:hypothetical protein
LNLKREGGGKKGEEEVANILPATSNIRENGAFFFLQERERSNIGMYMLCTKMRIIAVLRVSAGYSNS